MESKHNVNFNANSIFRGYVATGSERLRGKFSNGTRASMSFPSVGCQTVMSSNFHVVCYRCGTHVSCRDISSVVCSHFRSILAPTAHALLDCHDVHSRLRCWFDWRDHSPTVWHFFLGINQNERGTREGTPWKEYPPQNLWGRARNRVGKARIRKEC